MPDTPLIYDDDLAYIHDVGFCTLARGWSPGLLEILKTSGIGGGRVVDLGCGSGVWAEYLVGAGYEVIGVDVSAAMVDISRRRVRGAEFRVGSLWDGEIPRCRAVTALSEVVCYLADAHSEPDLPIFFRRAFDSLERGGLLIFDVAEVGLDRARDASFAEGDDWACHVRYEYDEARDQLTRHITAFRKLGELYRRTRERHTVQLYHAHQVAEQLNAAGFRVRTTRTFGEFPLLPMRLGFIAQKPPNR